MYGYSQDPLLETEQGILKNIYAGHVAMYIGRENGEDYIVEAMGSGIVKTPAKYFINSANQEVFLGAKLPRAASQLQVAKAVALAKSLAAQNLAYDFDFKKQKGPASGEWTCVGLTEKVYESADAANPNNLTNLEYDQARYAVDITPDGFDNKSLVNTAGDCFSSAVEFSKIARRANLLVPAPELIGYDVGLVHNGERYIFLPYTQFLQPTLVSVPADINLASSFSDTEIRGPLNLTALALRWSLINNPLSALSNLMTGAKDLVLTAAAKTVELAKSLGSKLFGSSTDGSVVLADSNLTAAGTSKTASATKKSTKSTAKKTTSAKNSAASPAGDLPPVTVNKAQDISSQAETSAASPSSSSKSAAKAGSAKATSSVKTASSTKSSSAAYYSPAVASAAVSSGNSGNAAAAADNWPKLAKLNRIYATGDNDWVELINTTDHDFDLASAGYRLEKTKTAVDPSLIMRIGDTDDGDYPGGTIIKAHDTYLIVASTANDYYRSRADALAKRDDFKWSDSGYTLYLGIAAITSNADADIVDAVGYGPDATYFQGDGPAPAITVNHILNRVGSVGNNRLDFNLVLSDEPGLATTTETTNDQTSASSTDGLATSTATVATTTAPTSTATSTDQTADEPATVTSSPLTLINKIYATGDNDWVELINDSDQDFDLAAAGYRLEKTMTATDPALMMRIGDSADGLYPGGTVIKAHDTYLIVRDQAGNYYRSQADAIATRNEFGWGGSGYSLYLGNQPISSPTDANIVDMVGFGPDATYWQGQRPAVAITDNYILQRIATSSNNWTDFNLMPSDDPSIIDNEPDDNLDLYIPPTPLISPDLTNLWHFDECYGPGTWTVGKWDCARVVGDRHDKIQLSLDPAANLNTFSMSFYYKKTIDNPRVVVRLSSADSDDKLGLILEPGLLTVEGLPESEWRYYVNVPFGDDWHQATLVINQASDYWAVYIDGRELVREDFMARLATMTDLELSGDCYPTLVDELAIWRRALSSAEVAANYSAAVPFSPVVERTPQLAAQLLHAWDFEEDNGALAVDSVGRTTLTVSPDTWVGRQHNNYALTIAAGHDLTVDFDEPISDQDLSLALWWRNSSYPEAGRAYIYLLGGPGQNTNLLALLADYFRLGYWFNGSYGILAEGINQHIPYDSAWHHLALVYDSYRYKLSFYVDGVVKASSSLIWMKPGEALSRLKILTDGYSSEIDDLRVYQGALSPKQIKEIYTNTK
jgi:hypothetical protein